jgi:hypothetical protein
MADTPDNVVPLIAEDDPGGVRKQRWRRGQSKPKKPRKKAEAKSYLSEDAQTAVSTNNTTDIDAKSEAEKSNEIKHGRYGSGVAKSAITEHDGIDVHSNEFRPVRRGGGGGNWHPGNDVQADGVDVAAYAVAFSLAGIAAWFSIHGMVVLFPGAPAIIAMAAIMEAAKLVVLAWLAKKWSETAWAFRLALIAFALGIAAINSVGVYSQLVAAHVGPRGMASAARDTSDADVAARTEVVQSRIADLDRRLAQIDTAVSEATRRGRTNGAMRLAEDQRRQRAGITGERERAAQELAGMKTQRVQVAAQGRAAEGEAAPVQYVAQLFGIEREPETIIRWLIAAMVLCCDPLALALTAAIGARRRRWS